MPSPPLMKVRYSEHGKKSTTRLDVLRAINSDPYCWMTNPDNIGSMQILTTS